jgi:hypothetical protein
MKRHQQSGTVKWQGFSRRSGEMSCQRIAAAFLLQCGLAMCNHVAVEEDGRANRGFGFGHEPDRIASNIDARHVPAKLN